MNKQLIYILFFTSITVSLFGQDNNDIQLANEYYGQGEYDKAEELYEDLAKNWNNIPLIHNNYFFLLLETTAFNDAEKYIKRLIKRFPDNLYYKLDYGLLLFTQEGERVADQYFNDVIEDVKSNNYLISITADYFVSKKLTQYAISAFSKGREAQKNPYLYSLEMANIYRIMNEKDKMVSEYLNYVIQNPSNLNNVRNALQNLLSTTEELESLESLLYDRIQKNPENDIYAELLIWVNLQLKNFQGAFFQARAIDRRTQSGGTRSLNIGLIALNNEDYTNAIKIFSYITDTYPTTNNYTLAKMYLISAYEKKARNTFPIDKIEIRKLVNDYEKFVAEIGINRNTLEALRNKALLHAFYLDEKDSAIVILQKIISTPRANSDIKSKSKIDLGDIYLLLGQPWESTLLYSQVEKSNKETTIGYTAKLKNAELSYYKGDFTLAEEHLNILKEATTREISNDAMAMSLLIKDNTVLDTANHAMKQYANIELLLYQNKTDTAFIKIDSMLQHYKGHSLTDELLWLKADLKKKEGKFSESLDLLNMIVTDFSTDILGDDAYFTIADIYDRQLGEKDIAMEYYRNFLTKYPGSVFVAEARKRFRELRGDFKQEASIVN